MARLGRVSESYADFSEAIRLSPVYVLGYAHRALAARQLGQEEQARADEEAVRGLLEESGGADGLRKGERVQAQSEGAAMSELGAPSVPLPASDKERFDACIKMLEGYYGALEGRLDKSIGLLVVVVGWLITSDGARRAIVTLPWLATVGVLTLTLVVVIYGLNVARWTWRWRRIRGHVEALKYIEPRFYERYELPKWTEFAYFGPVALLYLFIVGYLLLLAWPRSG